MVTAQCVQMNTIKNSEMNSLLKVKLVKPSNLEITFEISNKEMGAIRVTR